MSDKPENPPAFPVFNDLGIHPSYGGMSLRDWFAGQALVGFLADSAQRLVAAAIEESEEGKLIDGTAALESVVTGEVAFGCYRLADSMLAARGDPS